MPPVADGGVEYLKIPKISPGAYMFQRPFLRGLFLERLINWRKFAFQNRLGLYWEGNTHLSDSMLRTLHSDAKINILNPKLDVKMFIKGVQTYLESLFSVPFVPNKKMLWLALKTLKVWVEESVLQTLQFKQPLFKVTFFKEIFLWIFNLEQKIIVPSKHNDN